MSKKTVKKTFSTTMDSTVIQMFKAACAYKDRSMNDVLEELMESYIDNNLVIPVKRKEENDSINNVENKE